MDLNFFFIYFTKIIKSSKIAKFWVSKSFFSTENKKDVSFFDSYDFFKLLYFIKMCPLFVCSIEFWDMKKSKVKSWSVLSVVPEIKIWKVIYCTSVSAFKCNPCKFNLELLLGLFFRPLIRKLLAILGLKSKVLCFSAKPRLPWIFLTLTKVPMLLSTRTWSKWGQSLSECANVPFSWNIPKFLNHISVRSE